MNFKKLWRQILPRKLKIEIWNFVFANQHNFLYFWEFFENFQKYYFFFGKLWRSQRCQFAAAMAIKSNEPSIRPISLVESEIVIEVWNHWSNPPNCQYWRIIWIFCPKPIYFVTPLMLYISHRSIGLVRSIRFFLCFEWYARVRRQQQESPGKINKPWTYRECVKKPSEIIILLLSLFLPFIIYRLEFTAREENERSHFLRYTSSSVAHSR